MRISFERNPLIVQSDVNTLIVRIRKYDVGEVTFKVKAVGTSAALESKYRNRAIAGDSGEFFFEEKTIFMEEFQQLTTIEIKIYKTDRTRKEPKYFTLKLVNINENYKHEPNGICHCYIVNDIKEYLLENIERYNLPLVKVVNNIIQKKEENKGGGGGGGVAKAKLTGELLMETNDQRQIQNNLPVLIWKNLAEFMDIINLVKCKRSRLYKVLLLSNYTPGEKYNFSYTVLDELKNKSDITVHLIDMDFVLFMKVAFMNYRRQEDWQVQNDYLDAIGFIKRNSFAAKLNKDIKEGTFNIKPTTSRKILSFSARDENNQPDGIGFKYDKELNHFTLWSF